MTMTSSDIIKIMEDHTDISRAEIIGRSRKFKVTLVRHYCWWLLYKNGFSFRYLASSFCRASPSVIKHGLDKIENMIETNDEEILPLQKIDI